MDRLFLPPFLDRPYPPHFAGACAWLCVPVVVAVQMAQVLIALFQKHFAVLLASALLWNCITVPLAMFSIRATISVA